MSEYKVRKVKLEDLIPDDRNSNLGTEEGAELLKASFDEDGAGRSLLLDTHLQIMAGNKSAASAKHAGITEVIIVETTGDQLVAVQRVDVDLDTPQGRRMAVRDNFIAYRNLNWNEEELKRFLDEGIALDDIFSDDDIQRFLRAGQPDDETPPDQSELPSLLDRFLFVPFTILDARSGPWRERKAKWVEMGLKSGMGRGADEDGTVRGLTYSASAQPASVYEEKNAYEAEIGHKVSWDEFYAANPEVATQSGTSIFDPVLTELAYRWFCPPAGNILDPFAGGSVRGIVAELLKRHYTGIDLSKRQIEENEKQAALFKVLPNWIVGDSQNLNTLVSDKAQFDFIFSCPPYADLEVYSDDPHDLSTMDYPAFIAAYRNIIKQACAKLKDNRFACFVVGDVRNKKGHYYGFVSDTIRAFEDADLHYYNEGILITQAGSLAIRVGGQFTKSRKLGKQHQNVLFFVKGDPKLATEACGEVEIGMPESGEGEDA